MKNNPIQKAHSAPRCGAKTRGGHPCRSPVMKNGRCRMHGGCSIGAPIGNTNALQHGQYTLKAKNDRTEIAELIRNIRELIATDE
jgi:uncharacterized protein YjcR